MNRRAVTERQASRIFPSLFLLLGLTPIPCLAQTKQADLALTVTANTPNVTVGETMIVDAAITNLGPDAATLPGIGFTATAQLPDLSVLSPPGWTCGAPVLGNNETTVECASPTDLTHLDAANFQLRAVAPVVGPGGFVRFKALVDAQTPDPVSGNNFQDPSVRIWGDADLALRINTLDRWYRPSTSINMQIPVKNHFVDRASNVTVNIRTNLPPSATMYISSNGGGTCRYVTSTILEFNCTHDIEMGRGFTYLFSITIFVPNSFSQDYLVVRTEATSRGIELTPDNNVAIRRLPRR